MESTSSGSAILYLNKNMIDKAHGDTHENTFDKNFAIKLFMTRVEKNDFKYEEKQSLPIKVSMPG